MPKPFLGSADDLAKFLDKHFRLGVKENGSSSFKFLKAKKLEHAESFC